MIAPCKKTGVAAIASQSGMHFGRLYMNHMTYFSWCIESINNVIACDGIFRKTIVFSKVENFKNVRPSESRWKLSTISFTGVTDNQLTMTLICLITYL